MENLRKVLKSEAGKELKDFLIGEIAELATIKSVTDADEINAQIRAYNKLIQILGKIAELSVQDIDPKELAEKRLKDSYY